MNINAYHQPGVEAGKKAAAAILELQQQIVSVLQAEENPISLEEIASKAGASEQIESIYIILRHLYANGRGVVIEGNFGQPSSLKFSIGK